MIKIVITMFFISFNTFAQQSSEPLQISTNFKDGVTLLHQLNHFKMKFRFRVQNRFTYESESDEDLNSRTANFETRRMRIRMDGNLMDSRLLYKIQLSFTRGDFDYERTQYPNVLRDAAVGWKLTDTTTLWYGQMKLPGNRQRVISSGAQQFVDRSIVNATFNIDRDLGAQFYHQMGEEKPFWIKLALSNGEGRATDNKDNGLAYTSRIEWLPLGNFKDGGDYFEADLERETVPKISLGIVYSMNKKATRPGGQIGQQYSTKGLNQNIETWFADIFFKYQGLSWATEYAKRWANDAVFLDGTKNIAIYKGQGLNSQIGYIFENNIEPSIRYSRLWADREILSIENDRTQFSLCLSKYFNRHRVKLQTDLTYDEQNSRISGKFDNAWIYRGQLEIGI